MRGDGGLCSQEEINAVILSGFVLKKEGAVVSVGRVQPRCRNTLVSYSLAFHLVNRGTEQVSPSLLLSYALAQLQRDHDARGGRLLVSMPVKDKMRASGGRDTETQWGGTEDSGGLTL